MDSVYNLFTGLLKKQGIDLTENQWLQFESYCNELIIWNERMNLTAIKDREQIYLKHFYDSVSLSFFFPITKVNTVADIGSGAGFPSIPLKIIYPHLQITIIDSLNKRIQFLKHLVEQLELNDIHLVHARAEDAARKPQFRDHFDLVTARAVAKLNVLNELCLPFVKTRGSFVAMKGTNPKLEISDAKYSMMKLNASLVDVFSFDLPIEESDRHIIVIEKHKGTPAMYPRKAGIPTKDPLIKL